MDSVDDSDYEDEGDDYVDHEMLIHTFDLTADLMNGSRHLTIPDYIQVECFRDLSTEINVLLPNGSWRRWEIIWYSFGEERRESGMMGEVRGPWFNFYKENFFRLGNTVRRHKLQLWKMGLPNCYKVVVLVE
ncbi:uncharacterized protein LOC130732163 [Lotus japonicus]|uniref:uncharacterized protein LOC130732163 n=1 Tax=Lotus japonicus TaxID=34305 RepID=UPI002586D65C|nr:uncharacterized protein LOC130732163 [Lotus japonicus]